MGGIINIGGGGDHCVYREVFFLMLFYHGQNVQ